MRTNFIFGLCLFLLSVSMAFAAPCAFNPSKNCTLQRDILNDTGSNGLKFFAPTNYDHRMSGEINVYDASLTQPYTDEFNKPGQLRFLGIKINDGFWRTGEIMTRHNLDQAPWNAPRKSNPWTTREARHGYLEVVVRMPKCDVSSDGRCQANTQPDGYQFGLWPAIWLEPTMDANWPLNGEIDISEAYLQGTDYKTSTAALHFNGNDPRCSGGDCVFRGFGLPSSRAPEQLWKAFHTWGFEWEPDPASGNGGQILNGYFDNVKVWGPLRTDTLPADGPGALRRGFNDPNGGYYLIVNLAIGGPYAGRPNPQIQRSSMYLQSAKAFIVDGGSGPGPATCLPPANIKSSYTADKRQITLSWEKPANSDTILNYQVHDWLNRLMWRGTDLRFVDRTLPGTNGNFVYYLYSNCPSGLSQGVRKDVRIS